MCKTLFINRANSTASSGGSPPLGSDYLGRENQPEPRLKKKCGQPKGPICFYVVGWFSKIEVHIHTQKAPCSYAPSIG